MPTKVVSESKKKLSLRDNFSKKTIEVLAKRVGYRCSNPNCNKPTVGPSSDINKALNIGVASHISAASLNGPRYDNKINSEKRKSINNGIWLCQNCSILIDRDHEKYTCKLLREWKKYSEKRLIKDIEGGINSEPFFFQENPKRKNINYSKETITFINSNQKGYYWKVKNTLINENIYFDYFPQKKEWNNELNELKWDSPFYYTFIILKQWLESVLKNEEKNEVISSIGEIRKISKNKGMHGIAEFVFNNYNKDNDVPLYSEFVEAFEFFSKKDKEDFKIQTVGHLIYFKCSHEEYVMDTYEGKTEELRSLIEKEAYDDIYSMTNENIWSKIYLDPGIEKEEFIPKMLFYWEKYWDNLYLEIEERVGSTNHLNTLKEKSWRQFQVFSSSYNDIGDIIKFAYELDDMIFYPLAVITMMNIFDPQTCYSEYCEYGFDINDEWESICVDENFENKSIFYIKISDN